MTNLPTSLPRSAAPPSSRMAGLWYRGCHWLCSRGYFDRIGVVWPERLPEGGPVLYVGLHRNGAVDGFLYHQLVPRGVFMVSTQLRRSFFGKLFFGGIEVARKKDEEAGARNEAALARCVDLLAGGGELIIFPEGTSSLGPRHLPFKSGAASIAVDALAAGVPLSIVPLGIHYEQAWAFRSRVEIVVGRPVSTDLPAGLGDLGKIKELKRRMDRALEEVGVNFASSREQAMAEKFAYASTLGTGRSYFRSLKALEAGVPEPSAENWRAFARRLLPYHGVPLFPGSTWIGYLSLWLLLAPFVLLGGLLNFPPILFAGLAAWKFADETNVITLWRILVGMPVALIWAALIMVFSGCLAGGWGIAGYLALTGIALKFYPRVRKLSVALWNEFFHRPFRGVARRFHAELIMNLPDE